MLTGCESFSSMDPFAGDGVNYAAGAELGQRLSGADREALAAAFKAAMDTGAAQNWRGARATGAVAPGVYAIAGLKGDPSRRLPAARGDLDLAHVVETELGLSVLTRNSNVRIAPDPKAKIAEVLASGTGVDVVGRVRDKNWMLVAVDGVVQGYVFGDLMIKAPGSELELAGGPMRKPNLCREFAQRINLYSEREEWAGAACNDGTGWRLAPPAAERSADDSGLEGY
jgi:hypothetical protein